jgi:acetyl-CoA carboxylase carboxyltransferase component
LYLAGLFSSSAPGSGSTCCWTRAPFLAAKRGYIDDVIFPRDTRHRLLRTLQDLDGKQAQGSQRRHGNIPS